VGFPSLNTITLSSEDWRAVIAILPQNPLPFRPEHADSLEGLLEQHSPGEPTIRLSLTDDLFLRTSN